MIGIIDYGLGNVRAFANIYRMLNIPALIVKESHQLNSVSKVIIPGVGAFDHAMQSLQSSGMRARLDEFVLQQRLPVLGVCVGMQMLMERSDEGASPGLCWIAGQSERFRVTSAEKELPVPHMGWNDVRPTRVDKLFNNIDVRARFYFLHSYFVSCSDATTALAVSDYGEDFVCSVNQGNIFGVQFHPEKSHRSGIQLLQNFARL